VTPRNLENVLGGAGGGGNALAVEQQLYRFAHGAAKREAL